MRHYQQRSNTLQLAPGAHPACIRDLAYIGDPASSGTFDLGPWLVLETRLVIETQLLLEVLQYMEFSHNLLMSLENWWNLNENFTRDVQGGSKKVSCWHSTTAYFFWATLYLWTRKCFKSPLNFGSGLGLGLQILDPDWICLGQRSVLSKCSCCHLDCNCCVQNLINNILKYCRNCNVNTTLLCRAWKMHYQYHWIASDIGINPISSTSSIAW